MDVIEVTDAVTGIVQNSNATAVPIPSSPDARMVGSRFFCGPKIEEGVMRLPSGQLSALLEGLA
jgi:hypothetical protein